MKVSKIVNKLNEGKILITPTDTIYGITCDATNEESIKKVYQIKKRPLNKPLILLMNNYEMIKEYTKDITLEEENLIKEYMPGLVTIILKKNHKINSLITANTDYVAIRIPKNKDLLDIITKLNKPIISTSANISEEIPITNISELTEDIKNNVDYIEDAGTIIAKTSTIVKFNNHKLQILREGLLTKELKERFK